MAYTSINIQGNVLSGEILEKIRIEDIKYQAKKDFGLTKADNVRDIINNAWTDIRAQWNVFKNKRDRLDESDSGTTVTRKSWMIQFLAEFGYEVKTSTVITINDKSSPISHSASNRKDFPIHIVGVNQSLDRRDSNTSNKHSPHALVQEFLNNHDHLYAIVTNGKFLRLLRDATRLSRLSYLEFNIEKMMEEELFAEFAIMWRLLHVSRMPESMDSGEDSIIEFYHQDSLASGARIRDKLSEAVGKSILLLANGLISHPFNDDLRDEIISGRLNARDYYQHLLRLIYRILFLLVIEERHLIYPDKRDEAMERLRDIYLRFYSVSRLTGLAQKSIYIDPHKTDLWQSLIACFLLFEKETYGKELGIKPLGSGIFAYDAIGILPNLKLDNGSLLKVFKNLTSFINENQQTVRVNYADLDVEEFGSVYAGFLEFDPFIDTNGAVPVFRFVAGDERSSTGSHYTPEELVKPLIQNSLNHLIAEKLKTAKSKLRIADGEWQEIKSIAPDIWSLIHNLLINLIVENENLSGPENLENRNGYSSKSISLDSLLSKRRIIWDDFSTPKSFSFSSGKHSRGLGTKQQQGVQSISKDSKRQSEGSGNASTVISKSRTMQSGKHSGDNGVIQYSWEADTQLPTLNLSQKQLGYIWNILPHSIRYSLLANHYLLSLKIADSASGSGHILLAAARHIGTELARVRTGEEQPSPAATRLATRDVIGSCIYGVDLNPLAVELCKVALWLEAHNPGKPLNFLDHRIKCGNSIVGLAFADELKEGIAD
jgi:hypothetical protein